MSCGCKTSGDSGHSCGTKSSNGCSSVDTCGNSYKLNVFDWLSDVKNPGTSSNEYVEVRFKNDRKSFFKNTNNLPLAAGNTVTLEANPGHDIGVVSLTGELVKIQMKKKKTSTEGLLKVYRHATQKDIEVWQELRKKENDVKIQARKIAYSIGLAMKITDVEYQGDGSKITFYYTADSRVDFRQLIKEYAGAFRTKIDMKQIGFRQESAKVGGIGSCGRELCCSTWLTDFRSVNTNAARYQQLSINPQKLAGQCGKLKCCLNYELDSYMDTLRDFPATNTVLNTEKGKAFCIKIDVFKRKMWFAYVENSMAWYDIDITDVKMMISVNQEGKPSPALEDFKAQSAPVANVDLIQESSLDRFEKKSRPNNKKNPRNRNNDRSSNDQNNSDRPNNNRERRERNNSGQNQNRNSSKPNQNGQNNQNGNAQKEVRKEVKKVEVSAEANNAEAPKAKKPFNNKKKFHKKPNSNPNSNNGNNA
ncbi:Cell fate regulator YaaT, PSP1 superfamily (controls sporulation, competence, biofilm development) [Soonwooa buanensis]|uniref:Cell fate regulator YaaT, PSP1 superfamily (Controls sporulation, competence, biofilm development) n=1 Tax=Soonwooa buanensis TaxID=619805 RepID=A0A1T5E9R1_9FLAO|nr:regulatory iron-sulfur-containing complex subunit RicT [Soonwooa buanensis]SKB80465.1 Cell fate regulator YaaT, PSP1 superfamily (controls sporulation, competence, biofilm development) [Soonwooa buanensis]